MKAMLATLLLAFSTANANTVEIMCAQLAEVAESAMEVRQAGIPLGRALRTTNQEWAQRIILLAYQQPRVVGAVDQGRMVEAFRDAMFLSCMENLIQSWE